MLVLTKCKFCGADIKYDTEHKRAVEFDNEHRIHICPSRIVACKFCGKPIYFSFKKNQFGKSQAFSADTQTKHKCEKEN